MQVGSNTRGCILAALSFSINLQTTTLPLGSTLANTAHNAPAKREVKGRPSSTTVSSACVSPNQPNHPLLFSGFIITVTIINIINICYMSSSFLCCLFFKIMSYSLVPKPVVRPHSRWSAAARRCSRRWLPSHQTQAPPERWSFLLQSDGPLHMFWLLSCGLPTPEKKGRCIRRQYLTSTSTEAY